MWKIIHFSLYQFVLLILIFYFNRVFDILISKPFTYVDLVAICIGFPLIFIGYYLIDTLYKKFNAIRLIVKVLISIPIALLALAFVSFIEYLIIF